MSTVKSKIKNPGEIEITIEATFTLDQWINISNALAGKHLYPMSDLVDSIRSCTAQAEKEFIPSSSNNESEL